MCIIYSVLRIQDSMPQYSMDGILGLSTIWGATAIKRQYGPLCRLYFLHHCVCTVGASHPLFSYSHDSELSIYGAFVLNIATTVCGMDGSCRVLAVMASFRTIDNFQIHRSQIVTISLLLCTPISINTKDQDLGLILTVCFEFQ